MWYCYLILIYSQGSIHQWFWARVPWFRDFTCIFTSFSIVWMYKYNCCYILIFVVRIFSRSFILFILRFTFTLSSVTSLVIVLNFVQLVSVVFLCIALLFFVGIAGFVFSTNCKITCFCGILPSYVLCCRHCGEIEEIDELDASHWKRNTNWSIFGAYEMNICFGGFTGFPDKLLI